MVCWWSPAQVHARNFYLRSDAGITIAMLRKTNKVTRFTNEKIGTAGQPTGLDRTLQDTLAGGKLRCSKVQQRNESSTAKERKRLQHPMDCASWLRCKPLAGSTATAW
eukprot:GHRQ01031892.1.p1 GENE.GHRQ01031892.1~~GHRQ01031892.1.p1  ORF type:complete len:108 (-),score=25.89 GHRQ01031892.1:354-677(-)